METGDGMEFTDVLPSVESWLGRAPAERAEYGPEGPYFNAMYGDQDDGWPFWRQFVSGAVSVLEIGCGNGRLTESLAKWSPSVIGIDPNKNALEVARARSESKGQYIYGNASALPLADASVDRVLMPYSSIAYVLSPAKQVSSFREAARVLDGGGWLAVDVNFYPLGHPHSVGSTSQRYQSTHTLPDGSWFDVSGQADLDSEWNICEYRQIIDHFCDDGAAKRVATHHDLHLFTPFELYLLVLQAGLIPKFICGDYDGSALTGTSPRIILLAQKEAAQQEP